MWLLRAVKGWISIHHRSFSVALHLSVWFRQTICQEYANFGVLLQEVNEPLGVSMDKRLGWFPVVVTGIKAPPLTQKFPFALGVTSCFNNPLEFVLPPFDDPIGQVFCSPKKGFNSILGGGDLSLEAIARNVNFPADIHTNPPPVLTKTRCNSEWPLPQGKKLVISVQGGFGFSKPNSIIDFKIVGVFSTLILNPKPVSLMLLD